MSKNKVVVVSGANITSGGPLTVFNDVLFNLSQITGIEIIAIVNNKTDFYRSENITFIEISRYKKIIILKFYYEYIRFYFLSKKLDVALWFSVNDCTPSVKAKIRAVYCHNATPFYKKSIRDFFKPTRILFQSFYYVLFYRINLSRNNAVVVQQEWMRSYFCKEYNIPYEKIILSPPDFKTAIVPAKIEKKGSDVLHFIYPTKAQPYKNIEVICRAVQLLQLKKITNYCVFITINQSDNNYARNLIKKYKHLTAIKWLGTVPISELNNLYAKSDCLLFPSKLESWGLPITEAKQFDNILVLADLPYARETVGNYNKVKFFDPDCEKELAEIMINIILKKKIEFEVIEKTTLKEPVVNGFAQLFDILLNASSNKDESKIK